MCLWERWHDLNRYFLWSSFKRKLGTLTDSKWVEVLYEEPFLFLFLHLHFILLMWSIQQLIPELRFLNFFRISLFLTNQTMTNKQTNCVKLVLIRQIIYENSELRSSNWLLDPVNKIFLQIPCSLEGESFLISWGVAFTIGMIVWINTFFW